MEKDNRGTEHYYEWEWKNFGEYVKFMLLSLWFLLLLDGVQNYTRVHRGVKVIDEIVGEVERI